MPSLERSEIVPFSPDQMYALVMDVESYPEFLSWCGHGRILSEEEDSIIAELTLQYQGIHISFVTRNRFQRNRLVEMELVRGPFRFLEGIWSFESLPEDGTRVHLSLGFEFANRVFSFMLRPIFHQAVDTLVSDFCRRAYELHGQGWASECR